MSDEPGHKAMLYFLEVLMNSNGALTISQLAGRFGSSNFTAEMRTAAGGNEAGLKQFLQKYPSLFTIKGNMVSLCDGKDEEEQNGVVGSVTGPDGSVGGSGGTGGKGRSLPDVSVEMEAVQFFQGQLARRGERWVPIRSLAGHLSQTTPEIRGVVGPQLDFKKWLLRHMHIFEVQGDTVSLREGLAPHTPSPSPRRITFDLPGENDYVTPAIIAPPPKTPPAQRKSFSGGKSSTPGGSGGQLPRAHSFGDRSQLFSSSTSSGGGSASTGNLQGSTTSSSSSLPSQGGVGRGGTAPPSSGPVGREAPLPVPSGGGVGRGAPVTASGSSGGAGPGSRGKHGADSSPVTMTANEYNAVIFLKELLERLGPMELSSVLSMVVGGATDSIRSTIGPSRSSLESFLRQHSAIFDLGLEDGDIVDLVRNAKLSVIITGSRPTSTPLPNNTLSPHLRAAPGGGGGAGMETGGGALREGKGKIFHVAKLWGIVDLGDHEHVFFDRSIMKQPMDDLQKHFKTGEVLNFRATPAHKTSRAKWRAVHVWRDEGGSGGGADSSSPLPPVHDNNPSSEAGGGGADLNTSLGSSSFEDEMNEFLPRRDDTDLPPSPLPTISSHPQQPHSPPAQPPALASTNKTSFADARLSGAGVIQIWNFRRDEERNGDRGASVSVVPESYQMSASALSDLRFIPEFSPAYLYGGGGEVIVNGGGKGEGSGGGVKVKTFTTVACQTVSTSDIIATQLYQDS